MIIKCPKCDTQFEVGENLDGREGKCSTCGETFALDSMQGVGSGSANVDRPGGMSVFTAFLLGLAIIGGIAATYWYFPLWGERGDQLPIPDWTYIIGRFHPLLVHLPIGMLFGAVAIDFFSGKKKAARRSSAVTGLLWMATLGTVAAAIAGYVLAKEDSSSTEIVRRHMFGGIALLIFLSAALFFKILRERRPSRGRGVYRIFMLLSCAALCFTGHLGGTMTHGPTFLTKLLPAPVQEKITPVLDFMEGRTNRNSAEKKSETELPATSTEEESGVAPSEDPTPSPEDQPEEGTAPSPDADANLDAAGNTGANAAIASAAAVGVGVGADAAAVSNLNADAASDLAPKEAESKTSSTASSGDAQTSFYNAVIQPIFDGKCVTCHGEDKIKGKLRMDTYAEVMAGAHGEGQTIIPGDVEGSNALFRVSLPMDDDEHMPPEDKDQLTEDEVAILTWWVTEGADGTTALAETTIPENVATAITAAKTASPSGDPADPAPGDDAKAAETAAVADEANNEAIALTIEKVNNEIGAGLSPTYAGSPTYAFTALNVVDSFGDDQLKELVPIAAQIGELDLAESQVTDAGLETITGMSSLTSLKLQNTAITDQGLAKLAGLEKLESINLYGTKVTDQGLRKLAELPSLKRIYAWQTEITDAAAEDLSNERPDLEINTGRKKSALPVPIEEPAVEEQKEESKKEEA